MRFERKGQREMNRGDVKTIGLLSGGLDSMLALVHMHRLGFQVVAYHFANGFHAALHAAKAKPLALATAERLGVPLKVIDNSRELLEIVKHPAHGYGSNMNPCLDCRIMAFRLTFARLREEGAKFFFTGEVVGQRPMSQRRQAMMLIDREAGVEGYVLRPLSGRLLPPTIPETEGLISRAELLDISGRSRKRQMALAKEWGIETYESPAGGCTLTDPGFAIRMRDELRFGDPDVHEVQLLKVGRHFRLSPQSKVILGRNADDCRALQSLLGPQDRVIEARDMPGPLATIRGAAAPEAARQTAALVLRYAKADPEREHVVTVSRGGALVEELSLRPMSEAEAAGLLIAAEGGCGGFAQQLKDKQTHERFRGPE